MVGEPQRWNAPLRVRRRCAAPLSALGKSGRPLRVVVSDADRRVWDGDGAWALPCNRGFSSRRVAGSRRELAEAAGEFSLLLLLGPPLGKECGTSPCSPRIGASGADEEGRMPDAELLRAEETDDRREVIDGGRGWTRFALAGEEWALSGASSAWATEAVRPTVREERESAQSGPDPLVSLKRP